MIRAPATSANLGPGFDALGLALALHDRVEARVTSGGLALEVSGEGLETARAGESHLVVRAMRAAFDVLGGQPPGIALHCVNVIPHGRGLGSSAAAIVSGLLAARGLAADGASALPDAALFRLAAELEGHPDNVAACLAGGLTIAWTPAAGGPPRLVSLRVRDELRAAVCVAPEPLATEAARRVRPAAVPHAEAAANAGRSALLVAALTGAGQSHAGEPGAGREVLLDATEDFLHQGYRAPAMPHTADLMGRLRAAGIAAVVSGAGPSVLALTVSAGPWPGMVDSISRETGIAWRVIPLDVDRQGATLQSAAAGATGRDDARHERPRDPVQRPGAGQAGRAPQDRSASSATHRQA